MSILLINYAYDPGFASPQELLARYHSLTGWAEALAQAGARVCVLQRFSSDASQIRNDVQYHFVADSHTPRLRAWQIPIHLHQVARQQARSDTSTVAHVNGLLFPLQIAHLRRYLPQNCAVAVQHHAEKPWHGWKKPLQRWGLAAADGFLFAAAELAQPWQQARIIRPWQQIFQVMEGSTHFRPTDRTLARQETELMGNPLFLWVGRLDKNKDPLTVLSGFERALASMPLARLAMIYHTEELLSAIEARLAQNSLLAEAVILVGSVPHERIESYYNSADYFVLGSHHEGSGYALAEALACGVIPIVTDIPSFRVMTDQGRVGALWPAGDANALAEILRAKANGPISPQQARQFFESELSYPAIARQALAAYQTLGRANEQLEPQKEK